MKHLTDIEHLSKDEILKIINTAEEFKNGTIKPQIEGKTLALMFYENSTRTRCSFEMAGKKSGMNVIDFDAPNSSVSKGESLKDTLENLYAIGIDIAVIRHSYSGIINNIINEVKSPVKFVNAGDGTHAHPSQALLDFFTILENFETIENKKIAIIGDISHSRVAKSNIALLSKFGLKINLCSPSYMAFENFEKYNAVYTQNIKDAIEGANIIMALRVQNERHDKEGYPDSSEYKRLYGINTQLVKKYAADDVIIMHPGPVNRNVELSSELIDSDMGKTILEQARNGVYVRMAILNTLLEERTEV